MKKQRNIMLCILIVMLSLNACGNSGYTEETSMGNGVMMTGARMTREYVIENGLLTEEELEGVDIDKMIQEEKILKEDVDQIKVIMFEYQAGTDPESSMIFDFAEEKAYYYRGKTNPEKEFFLTGEQINEIREIIRNCAIYEWETIYPGTSGNSTGSFCWGLYYALEDGRIYTNAGWGVYGSMPGNFDILKKNFDAFWQ